MLTLSLRTLALHPVLAAQASCDGASFIAGSNTCLAALAAGTTLVLTVAVYHAAASVHTRLWNKAGGAHRAARGASIHSRVIRSVLFHVHKMLWRTRAAVRRAYASFKHGTSAPSVSALAASELLDAKTEQTFIERKYVFLRTHDTPLLTPFEQAQKECLRRRTDQRLRGAVLEYLGGTLPPSFADAQKPVLHLARHVATPNYETLLFAQRAQVPGFAATIGIDSHDRFAPQNPLKHALGKMSFVRAVGDNGVVYENRTVVDFNRYAGKPLASVDTAWGENLVTFHTQLLRLVVPAGHVRLHDDAVWIDSHGRGDLLEHYKSFLALFVIHGILFEEFLKDDTSELSFDHDVLLPAFAHIEQMFGLRPLIVPLYVQAAYKDTFWCSYPAHLLPVIDRHLAGEHLTRRH